MTWVLPPLRHSELRSDFFLLRPPSEGSKFTKVGLGVTVWCQHLLPLHCMESGWRFTPSEIEPTALRHMNCVLPPLLHSDPYRCGSLFCSEFCPQKCICEGWSTFCCAAISFGSISLQPNTPIGVFLQPANLNPFIGCSPRRCEWMSALLWAVNFKSRWWVNWIVYQVFSMIVFGVSWNASSESSSRGTLLSEVISIVHSLVIHLPDISIFDSGCNQLILSL